MKVYRIKCLECGSVFTVKYLNRGARTFCDKSCAQSYRNRLRATRETPLPPPERGVRFVPLTKGLFARVDVADFADVSRWNWCATKGGASDRYSKNDKWYAARGRTPKEKAATGRKAVVLLHRYILKVGPKQKIDHVDRDGLNNRRKNLRLATNAENAMNMPARNATGFKGVSRHKNGWRAVIKHNYRNINLGSFDTKEDAARAYDAAAIRLHPEHALLNFPKKKRSTS